MSTHVHVCEESARQAPISVAAGFGIIHNNCLRRRTMCRPRVRLQTTMWPHAHTHTHTLPCARGGTQHRAHTLKHFAGVRRAQKCIASDSAAAWRVGRMMRPSERCGGGGGGARRTLPQVRRGEARRGASFAPGPAHRGAARSRLTMSQGVALREAETGAVPHTLGVWRRVWVSAASGEKRESGVLSAPQARARNAGGPAGCSCTC